MTINHAKSLANWLFRPTAKPGSFCRNGDFALTSYSLLIGAEYHHDVCECQEKPNNPSTSRKDFCISQWRRTLPSSLTIPLAASQCRGQFLHGLGRDREIRFGIHGDGALGTPRGISTEILTSAPPFETVREGE